MTSIYRLREILSDEDFMESCRNFDKASDVTRELVFYRMEKRFWNKVGMPKRDDFNFRSWYDSVLKDLPEDMRQAKLLDLIDLFARRFRDKYNESPKEQQVISLQSQKSSAKANEGDPNNFFPLFQVKRKIAGRTYTIIAKFRPQKSSPKRFAEIIFERRPSGCCVHVKDVSYRSCESLNSEVLQTLDRAIDSSVLSCTEASSTELVLPGEEIATLLQGTLVKR